MNTSEQEYRNEGLSIRAWLMLIASVIIIGIVVTMLIVGRNAVNMVAQPFVYIFTSLIALAGAGAIYMGLRHWNAVVEAKKFQSHVLRPNANNMLPGVYVNPEKGIIQGINGEMPQPVPAHYSPTMTYHNDVKEIYKILELAKQQPMMEIASPEQKGKMTFEDATSQVQRNSLQICLGWDSKEQQYIIEDLRDNHLLLIGGTRKGKTCEAAQIVDQLTRTHDREHLLLSILDLEDGVCNLFSQTPHILRITNGSGKTIKSIARTHADVVTHLGYLVDMMDYRYTLSPREREAAPKILVYIEEFVELKRRLRSKPELLLLLADRFTILATRGIKAGIHLMVCAQASYSQEEFREAMGQLIGINLAFCANPTLARAAGFQNYEQLKENYLAKTPGQFALESTQYNTVGIAPVYDVKAKLLAAQDAEESRISITEGADEGASDQHLLLEQGHQHPTSTLPAPSMQNLDAPAWGAYTDVIEQYQSEGMVQDPIIDKIWHVKKGSSAKYKEAREIYRLCDAAIKERREQKAETILAVVEG